MAGGVSRRGLLIGTLAVPVALSPVAADAARRTPSAVVPADGVVEPESTFFATVSIPYAAEVSTDSDGDLWPSAWADDGSVYAANGDGRGFSSDTSVDIVANRIDGLPPDGITGARLAASDAIGPIWSDPTQYNRKPTGMLAIDGDGDGVDELYLAVQDLKSGSVNPFDDAAAASISKSTDHGATWTHTDTAMFPDHVFTTIFFLDFGQSSGNRAVLGDDADYVYAYGLDGNWRTSYADTVPDPVDVYLARVPVDAVQDRASWQFFTGLDGGGAPTWSADIGAKTAVLHDDRRLYPSISNNPNNGPTNITVISQGSVIYNAPLKRYIYSSWSEYTFEFYEAPAPWGPWKLFLHKDFGPYPWWGAAPGPKNGGYATTIPTKFVSDDGLTMWVQANWFVGNDSGNSNYDFSLRRLVVTPYQQTTPANGKDATANLARTVAGTVAIDKTSHYGNLDYLNDGNAAQSEDSWDGTAKTSDQWGYTWPRAYNLNRLVYTTGTMFGDGGWFASDLRVQVRQNQTWTDVTNLTVTPDYPYSNAAGTNTTYTFTFDPTWGDGIRLYGVPGGTSYFTSVAELEVYYA
jgi:hypothetical protein